MPTAWSAILSPEMWPTFVFITARLVGLFSVAPLWSMGALPRTARAAILVVMALVLLPGAPHVRMPEQVLELPVPIAMEVLLGLSIGLVAAVVVQGAGLAGELVSLQMGLQLGPALAPMVEFEASGVAQLQTMLATVIYGSPMELGEGGRAITAIAGTLFSSAVRTGGPVIVALLVTNVALAILSRAVPQLNAMMVSFPLTIAVGLVMVGATLPITAGTLNGWVHELPGRIAVVTGAFRALPAGP